MDAYYAVAIAATREDAAGQMVIRFQAAVLHVTPEMDVDASALETARRIYPLADGWVDHAATTVRIGDAIVACERAEAGAFGASLQALILEG